MQFTYILGALDEEIDGVRAALTNVRTEKAGAFPLWRGSYAGKDVLLGRCGVGKSNAAAATAAALTAYPAIARVINTGVAGGLGGVRRGEVVLGTRTVHHDFDATADGKRKGQIEGFDSEFFDADPLLLREMESALQEEKIAYRRGIIASGHQFIANKATALRIAEEFGASACEMESASVAQVCALFGVPFLALRAVSDDGGDGAVESFYAFLHAAAANNARALLRFLRKE